MVHIADQFGFTPASRRRIYSFSKCNELLLNPEKMDEWGGI